MARVLVGYAEDAAPVVGDDEDFVLDGLGRFRLAERLVGLLAADEVPRGSLLRTVRAEGLLPAGHAAEAPFDEACERARRLLRALRAGPGLAPAEAPRMIAVSCGHWRISGSLPTLDSRGVVLARCGRWHGQHALELALGAKLACMAGLAAQPAWALAESGPAVQAWRLDPARLPDDWLARFIDLYQRSRRVPLPLWRKTSWAHASADEADRMKAARAEWEDGFRHGGEHGDPASAVLARAFDDPLGGGIRADLARVAGSGRGGAGARRWLTPARPNSIRCGVETTGTHLVEANAGTGKTHSLSALFLRVVVEGRIDLGAIALVTFTDAAARELRERLLGRLRELSRILQQPAAGAARPSWRWSCWRWRPRSRRTRSRGECAMRCCASTK